MRRWYPYIWISVTGFLLYLQTLSFGFTYFDDGLLILNNYNFLKNLSNVVQVFRQHVFNSPTSPIFYYRPFLIISFMLDSQVIGPSPVFFHLTNITVHVAAACLLFLFLEKLSYKRGISLFLSIVFVVHPILSQAVGWIPGRNDSLLTVFVLISFIMFMDFLRTGRIGFYILHLAAFILALFTKESAIGLVILYPLFYYLVLREKARMINKIALVLGWIAGLLVWQHLRWFAIGSAADLNIYEILESVRLNLGMVIQSIGKVVFPFNLSVFPVKADTTPLYGLIAITAFLGLVLTAKEKRFRTIIFGLAWFFIFLIPSFVRPSPYIIAPQMEFSEHRLYLPIVGLVLAVAELCALRNIDMKRKEALVPAVLIIVIFSFITFNHTKCFRDKNIFWANALKTSPHSAWVHFNTGMVYHSNGLLDKAEAEYKKSLELNPQQSMAHVKLGLLYIDRHMAQKAEAEFKKEIAINPLYDGTWVCLGTLYYNQGRTKEAEMLWKKAIEINELCADAHKNLAIYYYEKKDIEKAVYHVRRLQATGAEVPAGFLKTIGL